MKLPCSGELHEVINIRRDENAVLVECSFQDRMIESPEQPTVARVNGVEPVVAERLGDPRREVLIEQELDVHAGVPCVGRPSRRRARTRRPRP